MRRTVSALLFFIAVTAYTQTNITGIVIDQSSNTPLPFALIITSSGDKIIGDSEGKFNWNTDVIPEFFNIHYPHYESIKVPVVKTQFHFEFRLEKTPPTRHPSNPENDTLASHLIEKAIKQKVKNDPEKGLRSFEFDSYSKIIITADKDSIVGKPDSIFIRKKGKFVLKTIDTTSLFLKKQLANSHLFISEKISEIRFKYPGRRQEYILGSHISGFEKPVNELLTLSLQSFSLYKDTFTLVGEDFKAPLAHNALKHYDYKVLDTVKNSGRLLYILFFYPKKTTGPEEISGLIYLDKENLAIQKGVIQLKKGIIVNAVQNFKFFKDEKCWFPVEKNITIRKKPNSSKISLFGNTINIDKKNKYLNDSISLSSHQQKISDYVVLNAKEQYFNIKLNTGTSYPAQGIDIVLDKNIAERDEFFWNKYRQQPFSEKDRETYRFLDSLSTSKKVETKVSLLRKLTQGYLGTRYVDFDLRYLIKYNNFEGFKPGVGAITNDRFSKKLKLSAYGLYGFKDKDFKYGLGIETKLNRYTDTWVGFMFTDDLTETGSEPFITDGRAFYVFEPRLFNITLFHKNKTLSPFIKHDITPALTAKLQVNKSDIAPTFDYEFLNDGNLFTNYKIASVQLALQWTPLNTFLLDNSAKKIIKKKYPQFTLQFTKGLQNFLDADFDFSKLNFRGIYEFNNHNGDNTSFLLKAGLAWGDLPLTELYHVSPNNPDNTSIMRRFSVADSNSFETMFFNEFFSDRFVSFQVRHKFMRFMVSNKFKPQLVLVSRLAFGSVSNKAKHLNFGFNTLEKGFYESGLELNHLFKGFGISTFYRYGPYALEGFDQNLSLKFTFNFSLGF